MTANKLIVHVGGARGVGKSALLGLMSQTMTKGLPLVVIPVSAFVQQLGRDIFSRNWAELTVGERDAIRNAFIQQVERFPKGVCVLDSHYVDVLPDGTVTPIIPITLRPLLQCHVVVDCSSQALLTRRRVDLVKLRPLNEEWIARERCGELSVAQQMAQETHTPFHTVLNEQDVKYAAHCLGDIINTLWHTLLSSPQTPPK
jgi:hypothetical protein